MPGGNEIGNRQRKFYHFRYDVRLEISVKIIISLINYIKYMLRCKTIFLNRGVM